MLPLCGGGVLDTSIPVLAIFLFVAISNAYFIHINNIRSNVGTIIISVGMESPLQLLLLLSSSGIKWWTDGCHGEALGG